MDGNASCRARALHDLSNRPLSFISKCELGERRVDPIDLWKLAGIYEKPLEYFYPVRASRPGRPRHELGLISLVPWLINPVLA